MSDELKKIYSKYFDDSGEMKPKGKAIMGEGLKGLKASPVQTLTEKGAFLPKAKDVVTKAAKASKYGKIAAGVAGAGLALKQYLKSKMSNDEVSKKSMGGKIYKANEGMSASEYFGVEFKDTSSEEEKESNKKSAKALAKEVSKKSIGGDMKKGYGKARTSGMGLQDENITLGKGSDYIKDLL